MFNLSVDQHLFQVSLVANEARADQDAVLVQVEGERLPRVVGHLQAHPQVHERHQPERKKGEGEIQSCDRFFKKARRPMLV